MTLFSSLFLCGCARSPHLANSKNDLPDEWSNLDSVRYHKGRKLGEGNFGTVISAEDKYLKCEVAIKRIPHISGLSNELLTLIKEILILDILRHRNIVSLLDVDFVGDAIYIVTEKCPFNLNAFITGDKRERLTAEKVLQIMYQTLKAVAYMHHLEIMHRDIKPDNILLDQDLNVKLCDFGLAKYCNQEQLQGGLVRKHTEYMVTRWYRAPEVILCAGDYGFEQDIWSTGCIFGEIILKDVVFPGINHVDQIKVIIKGLGHLSESDMNFNISEISRRFLNDLLPTLSESRGTLLKQLKDAHIFHPHLLDLIQNMLKFNPSHRYTAVRCLYHPVFDNIKFHKMKTNRTLIQFQIHSQIATACRKESTYRLLSITSPLKSNNSVSGNESKSCGDGESPISRDRHRKSHNRMSSDDIREEIQLLKARLEERLSENYPKFFKHRALQCASHIHGMSSPPSTPPPRPNTRDGYSPYGAAAGGPSLGRKWNPPSSDQLSINAEAPSTPPPQDKCLIASPSSESKWTLQMECI